MTSPDGDLVPYASSAPATDGSVEVAMGRTLAWHEAGYGQVIEESPHAFAVREITAVPGAGELDLHGAPNVWQAMRNASFSMLSGAALTSGCDAFELRYVATPHMGQPTRLQMFVIAKSLGWYSGPAEAAVDAACAVLPSGFSWTTPTERPQLGPRGRSYDIVAELHRYEEITEPEWTFVPTQFYYSILDDPGDGSGWPAFWNLFAKVSRSVEVSVLFRATELDAQERHVLGRITSDLSLYGHDHTDYDAFGNQVNYPADTNALVAFESWSKRIDQLQRPILGRIAVRGEFDAVNSIASALATAIGAKQSGYGPAASLMVPEIALNEEEERSAFDGFDWLEIFPWGGAQLWGTPEAPRLLRRLPYLYGVNEAAGLAILPVPDDQGAPGFERARRNTGRRATITQVDDGEASIPVGDVLHHGQTAGEARLPLKAINRHTLVVGASGWGKTTTVHTMLAHLWREHRIPFLAIEPTKTEYRGLLKTPGIEELAVYCLGRDDLSPMRLNPLAPPPGVRREVHEGSVMATLKMALPLFAPLPQLIQAALDETYTIAGWDYDTVAEDGLTAPTLRDLLWNFDSVFEREGYVGEAKNMAAAFRVRMNGLLQGSRGRVLDTVESMDFADLMRRPVVIELDELADGDDKSVMAAFILDRIRSAARARGATDGQLRHVTVLEEAHRLLARSDQEAGNAAAGDSGRAEAVRAFCEAIRELRSQGEGFVLSSQRPSDLADAAVATTSVRILHRLEAASDRNVVLDDLDASPLDREAAARLKEGEAVVRWMGLEEPELVIVRPAAGIDTRRALDNDGLAAHMAGETAETRALLPFSLCTREVCVAGCDARVRREGALIAKTVKADARTRWDAADRKSDAVEPIAAVLADEAAGDAQRAYCAAAHLATEGDAFRLRSTRDIRPQVAAAIHKAVQRP